MLPGPDQIVACPHCKGLAKYMTLMSGNTFGARVWTDGKQVAPMLPHPPTVVKCRNCVECYWLTEAKEIGSVDPWGDEDLIDPTWAAAQEVQEPGEDEYYEILDGTMVADRLQQRKLRVLAWWRRNDAFRDDPEVQAPRTSSAVAMCRKNLEALVRLFDEANEDERLMKAEVLRELGEFEPAKQVLSRVTSVEFTAIVRQLRLLCDSGDTCVRELTGG